MADLFVRRPILAIVISILIVLVGAISLTGLPVEEYPDVTPPQIQVSAVYPGASAQVIEETVATPLELEINGVDGMLYMQSTAANDGSLSISVFFKSGTNLDNANMLVQNRVAQAQSKLPQDVVRQGITVKKAQTNILMLVSLSSPKGTYDQTFLANYANINIKDQLLRIPGIGRVDLMGRMDYSMRIWVRPDRLAQLALTPADVVKAIQEQNLQAPAGQVGAPPQPSSVQFQYTVRAPARLSSPDQFGDVIVKSNPDGSQVRVRDVARVELGAEYYSTITRMNGRPVGLLAIYQTPGGDALRSATLVRKRLDELAQQFPADVDWSIPYDTTPPISASIEEITKTLFEAVVLVVLVVFLFLQNWRATLIPMLTVPVALIGTFALFPLFGFSVNVLTMFGLVLAIGIVVDDAIVVVEAVMHHMEHGLDRRAATLKAMQEVSGPVVAIALILCAVFIPVAFMSGITGALYKQFAVTIAVAVVLSAINALTLSPALCSMLLTPPGQGRGPLAAFFRAFNAAFERVTGGYTSVTRILVRRTFLSLVIMVAVVLGAAQLMKILPGGFLPQEDKGVFIVNLQLPDAASQSRTDAVMKQVEAVLKSEPDISSYTGIVGTSILTGAAASNAGSAFVSLKPWDARKAPEQHVNAVIGRVNAKLAAIPEARAFAFGIPPVPGLGLASGFTFELQDRGRGTPAQLAEMARAIMFEAAKRPELTGVFSGYSAAAPQVSVDIDREAVRKLGVPIDSVFQTLQAFLGGAYANDFNAFGRVYKVYVQSEPEFRRAPEDIRNFFVRSQSGQMVPLGTIVRVGSTSGPEYIKRHNLYRAAEITGSAAHGYSSIQAIDAMEDLAATVLPRSYGYEWAGQSLQEKEAQGQAAFIFALAILFVFLLLSAQYESWSLPFSVLLGTPFALLGALLGTWLYRLDNNIYTQVGIVLLIGLAAKNAILIVEFAKMKREAGVPVAEAALEGARLRFRPILMTSFAFILGCVPLMLATGSGAASRTALGTAVVFGMSCATLIGVFLVPFLYTAVQGLSERFGGAPRPSQQQK